MEPQIRRKFVLTDLHSNHNKFWLVEYWPDGRLKTTWGRVGVTPQTNEKQQMGIHDVHRLIREKENKGYTEIDLYRPAPTASSSASLDPCVESLIQFIYTEANDRIASYLAVGVDALSPRQINEGRARLAQIQQLAERQGKGKRGVKHLLVEAVEAYLNIIPTRLPARIDIDEVVSGFIANLGEHEDRLNQLEAALATYSVQNASGNSQLLGLGGVQIQVMEPDTKAYRQIGDYVQRTSGGGRQIRDIFSVTIPGERDAWEQETRGKRNVRALFHGTRSCNVRHILRSGLIIPQIPANGSRWGRGIYFADRSRRSLNYCHSWTAPYKLLFVADVALGKSKRMDGEDPSLRQAPSKYDSVWGIKSYGGMDEFVIYQPSQQTVRALVTVL